MKSFVIVVKDNEISELGYQELVDSYMHYGHYDGIEPHYAIALEKVDGFTSGNGLQWNYPWTGEKTDLKTQSKILHTVLSRDDLCCELTHFQVYHFLTSNCSCVKN